jgi:hypothetical protein
VQAIDREQREQVGSARGHPGDAETDGPEVRDRVLEWDRRREGLAHRVGREATLRDEEDGAEVARRIEADGLHAVRRRGHDDEATEERGRRVVGVPLDAGRDQQLGGGVERPAKEGVRGHHPRDRRRGRRAKPAGQRDLVVHLDAPADTFGQLAARRAERGLESSDEAVVAILTELIAALALDR